MGKHTPFTSEPSKPHESKAEPDTHVEIYHYGEDGKEDKDLTVRHVTDEDTVKYGERTQELRDQQKQESVEAEESDEADSSDSSEDTDGDSGDSSEGGGSSDGDGGSDGGGDGGGNGGE